MPLPRCPACGSVIFPSARRGGDASPLCENCHAKALEEPPKGAPLPVREELVEPSGPFLMPGALPPPDVLERLGSKPPPAPKVSEAEPEAVVIEPSGPFALPAGAPVPEALMASTPIPPADDDEPEEVEVTDDDVVEPSGPFMMPGASGATGAPVSLEGAGVDPYLHPGSAAVVGGVVRGAVRARPRPEAEGPSIVVDPGLTPRPEPGLAIPHAVRDALHSAAAAAQASWTPLAIAFVAGMLAGVALAIAILRM